MQSLVSEHSSSIDHNNFLEECSIILINRTDGSDPTRGEEYWRRVTPVKTVTPYGLNTVEWLFHLGEFINLHTILYIF